MYFVKSLIWLLVSLSLSACQDSTMSSEDRRAFADEKKAQAERIEKKELVAFIAGRTDLVIDPTGYDSAWNKLYTAEIQNKYEGAVVAFEASILDIVRKDAEKYTLILGNEFFSATLIKLDIESDRALVLIENKIQNKDKNVLVIARFERILPLTLEIRPCIDEDCAHVDVEVNSFFKDFIIFGKVIDVVRSKAQIGYE